MAWMFLTTALSACALGCIIYLISRFHRFGFIRKAGERNRLAGWLLAALPVAALFLFALKNLFTMIVVVLHLAVFWIIADLAAWIIRKCLKKQRTRYVEGAAALIFTFLYLSAGWYNDHHVTGTFYELKTDKELGQDVLRVAFIADSHLGVTMDGEKFADEMEKLGRENPDIVIVAGDFVDDDSVREDMETACRALGSLETTFGVYFVFGNHDRGYYGEGYRDFTAADLTEALRRNGVFVLEDESVLINDSFYIIGRKDRSDPTHESMDAVIDGLDSSRYMIVADHQPNDFEGESAAGVDLVVAGHTHGGHIWPTGYIGKWAGIDDLKYGEAVRDNTTFIVTSGISAWAIPFKTGTFSEYVVIDITEGSQ